ncbi:TolC family protein [Corallococcus sp. M34]|nr:TolC family protein [Citreicoccus inhibens]
MRREAGRVVAVGLMLSAGMAGAQIAPTPAPGLAPGTAATGTTSPTPGSMSPGASPSPGSQGAGASTPSTSPATPSTDTGTSTSPSSASGANAPATNTSSIKPGIATPRLPPGPPAIAPQPAGEPGNAVQTQLAPAAQPEGTANEGAQPPAVPDSTAPAAKHQPLTLAQLVARARATDSRVAEATAELRKFQALYQQAKWAWFPKFEVTLGAGGPIPEARNNGLGGPPTTKASLEGDWNFGKVGVTVFSTGNAVLPLYTFGKLSALKKAGEQGPIVGAALRERARDEAGYQAAQAYYGYQLARAGVEQINDVSKRLEDAGRRIDALLAEDSAQVSKLDTYKVRYFRQLVEARKAEAQQGMEFALTAIRLLANAAPGESVTVVSEELALDSEVKPPTLEASVREAESRRPEISAITAGIIAREQEVKIREMSYYPDLGLAGFYDIRWTSSATRQLSPFAYDPYNERTAGIGLVMRGTFDIPVKDAQLEQARAELDKLRAQELQIHAGIQLEVTQVHGQLVAAYARAQAFNEAEKNARRWVTAAFAAFDLGTGDTRELVDAFTALAQASSDKAKSWHDVRLGLAGLARVTGHGSSGE